MAQLLLTAGGHDAVGHAGPRTAGVGQEEGLRVAPLLLRGRLLRRRLVGGLGGRLRPPRGGLLAPAVMIPKVRRRVL